MHMHADMDMVYVHAMSMSMSMSTSMSHVHGHGICVSACQHGQSREVIHGADWISLRPSRSLLHRIHGVRQVNPRAKRAAPAGQDHGTHARVLLQLPENPGQRVAQVLIDGIPSVGTIQRHDSDGSVVHAVHRDGPLLAC